MCLSPLQIQKPVQQPPLGGHMVAVDLGACPGGGSVAHLTLCGHQLEVQGIALSPRFQAHPPFTRSSVCRAVTAQGP